MDRGRGTQRDRWENSRTGGRGCVSRYTASSQSAAEVFHSRGYYCWRYVREIHLEECTRYTAVQATASRFHRCPRSPVRDRRLHASTGLNHKIVPERLRNSADLRGRLWLSCTLAQVPTYSLAVIDESGSGCPAPILHFLSAIPIKMIRTEGRIPVRKHACCRPGNKVELKSLFLLSSPVVVERDERINRILFFFPRPSYINLLLQSHF